MCFFEKCGGVLKHATKFFLIEKNPVFHGQQNLFLYIFYSFSIYFNFLGLWVTHSPLKNIHFCFPFCITFDQSLNLLSLLLCFPFCSLVWVYVSFLFPCYAFGAQLHYVAHANVTIIAKPFSWDSAYSAEAATWLQAF